MNGNRQISDQLVKLFESRKGKLFKPKEKPAIITQDDRLIEKFKEIIDFVDENDFLPNIDSNDINEALLAKRLEFIKNSPEKVEILNSYDSHGLLSKPKTPKNISDLFDSDNFGLFRGKANDILKVKNVPVKPRASSDKVAKRKKAKDFNKFKDGFVQTQKNLKNGTQKLVTFTNVNQLKKNRYYVSGGQLLFVSNIGEAKHVHGRMKSRIRAIFENGTESNMYLRSLSSQLYYDGYCVVSDEEIIDNLNDKNNTTGYIYIVKSLSDDPKINTVSDLYKIGFSRSPVSKRLTGSQDDPTYLMSDLELIESYRLTGNYNPQKVEHMIHRVFSEATLDITITDKHGKDYTPTEWYSVPIQAIRHTIDLIDSGEITNYMYDPELQQMVFVEN
ncbi:MAG: GIY-YIG nuclease family protein [Patescibacteria group bacterium]|nr:GIY-YIG nuclease family protein [Patescibacteria group bacterium]